MEAVQSASSVSNVVDPAFGVGDHHVHVHEDAWDALVHAGEDGSACGDMGVPLCWLLRQNLIVGKGRQTHGDIWHEMPVQKNSLEYVNGIGCFATDSPVHNVHMEPLGASLNHASAFCGELAKI